MATSTSSAARTPAFVLAVAVSVAGVGTGVGVHRLAPSSAAAVMEGGSRWRAVQASRTPAPGPSSTTASPETTTTTTTTTVPETTTTVDPKRPTHTRAELPPVAPGSIDARVSAFGDSVMLESEPELASAVNDLSLDAVIGRQAAATLEAVRTAHDAGQLGDEIVVQVGNNGEVTADEFDEIMSLLSGASRVLVVNVKVDRDWEGPNNDLLAARIDRWPNAVLLDWYSLASTDPEGLLSDGVHLQPAGVELYTRLILSGL